MELRPHFSNQELNKFEIKTLMVESKSLKNNPLKDSAIRYNQVLLPKLVSKNLPVVLILSGFAGNGSKYFNVRFHEENFPQTIDRLLKQRLAPKALYVFVDALTYWGGSQFINSSGTGNYEDYIVNDLIPEIKNSFSVSEDSEKWCVMGGSSGGYGALHLASTHPNLFGTFAATAPDSFFDLSLLPEIYSALPVLNKYEFSLPKIKKSILEGDFFKNKNSFSAINAIGMGSCYAPKNESKNIHWPVNYKTGELDEKIWEEWRSHDPVCFLNERVLSLKKIKNKYLDVGLLDEYHLLFGSRMIKNIFKKNRISLDYEEFKGSHRDISNRRPMVLDWLHSKWK